MSSTPDFQSLLFSAVNFFTISSFSNTGRIEVNPSLRLAEEELGQMYIRRAACQHSAGSSCICIHGLSETRGSITWFINVYLSPGCFSTGGPWVKYIRWHSFKQRKETRKKEGWGGKGPTPRRRYEGMPGRGSWPNPERENRLLGYVFKAVNLM